MRATWFYHKQRLKTQLLQVSLPGTFSEVHHTNTLFGFVAVMVVVLYYCSPQCITIPLTSRSFSQSGLFLSESLRLFDGEAELLDQLFVAFVRRQVESVEAGVTSRKPSVLSYFLDAETLRSVAPWS